MAERDESFLRWAHDRLGLSRDKLNKMTTEAIKRALKHAGHESHPPAPAPPTTSARPVRTASTASTAPSLAAPTKQPPLSPILSEDEDEAQVSEDDDDHRDEVAPQTAGEDEDSDPDGSTQSWAALAAAVRRAQGEEDEEDEDQDQEDAEGHHAPSPARVPTPAPAAAQTTPPAQRPAPLILEEVQSITITAASATGPSPHTAAIPPLAPRSLKTDTLPPFADHVMTTAPFSPEPTPKASYTLLAEGMHQHGQHDQRGQHEGRSTPASNGPDKMADMVVYLKSQFDACLKTLHNEIATRKSLVEDDDYNESDLDDFDRGIKDTRSKLNEVREALQTAIPAYCEFVRRRNAKDQGLIQRHMLNDETRRKWARKRLQREENQKLFSQYLAGLEVEAPMPNGPSGQSRSLVHVRSSAH
jgi:hypothetical protein